MSQTSLKKLYKKIFPIALLVLLFASLSYSQQAQTSYKILGITVEGNKSADAGNIIASSGLKVGDEIQTQGDQTVKAIHQLWNLGIFSDVQIIIEKQVGNGVFLLIKVKEYPRFEKLVIEGNDDLSKSDIEAKFNYIRGQTVKPQEIAQFKQDILGLYEKDGYLNAVVDIEYFKYYRADTTSEGITTVWRNEKDFSDEYEVKYDKDEMAYSDLISKIHDRVLIMVKLTEHQKVIVRQIVFEGNKAFTDSDLRGVMDNIEESKWWKFWSSAKFDPKKFKEDKKSIVKYYQEEWLPGRRSFIRFSYLL